MFRFGLKLGVAGGACYYLADEGIWKESERSTQVYEKICRTCQPIINQLPFEIPSLPATDKTSFLAKHYWNAGVLSVFDFLVALPRNTAALARKGTAAVFNNPEIQKMLSGGTGAETTAALTPPSSVDKEKNILKINVKSEDVDQFLHHRQVLTRKQSAQID